jgi:RNA polymerase sigma-70 factor (ECF subfamily)
LGTPQRSVNVPRSVERCPLAAQLGKTRPFPATDARSIEQALQELVRIARSTYPDLAGDDGELVRHLAAHLPPEQPALDSLRRIHAGDFVLAWACLEGQSTALQTFERLLARVVKSVHSGHPSHLSPDDLQQSASQFLLVGGVDSSPKLAQYGGRGALAAWLRVVASRMSIRLGRANPEILESDDELEQRAIATADAELEFIRSRYRAPFKVAFQAALAALSPEQRSMLRLCFVEGLSHREIARLHEVHQTTITRRISGAQTALHAALRGHLQRELKVGPRELDSLVRAVRSGLEMSLGTLLRSSGET